MTNSQQNPLSPSVRPTTTSAQASSLPTEASSAPSRRDLASWWKQFKRNTKKDDSAPPPSGIFGVPLNVSIKYANVAISLTGDDGKSFVYGYVPIVVAKCGVFLKEKATDVEGIFRLSGSAKRIKDLQEIFNSPDRYGKGLDWTGYTVHDAANVLRRYLNQLPEPIVPLRFYERFRDPLQNHRVQKQTNEEDGSDTTETFSREEAVVAYQQLIKELPPLNRQLLLYILDLLTVFASKSDFNRMTAANLAAIFQPGLLSHPSHDMSPEEYRLSQDVLVFLIENQDNFLFGMTGTAADEQTVKEMQEGIYVHSTKPNIRRSASNASAGADSVRKYENLRRNVSVSSRHSKNSGGNVASPATPKSINSFGVHRSNTVPSKRPPALSPNAFNRSPQPSAPRTAGLSPPASQLPAPCSPACTPPEHMKKNLKDAKPDMRIDIDPPAELDETQPQHIVGDMPNSRVAVTPNRERKLGSLFPWSSPPEDGRQPNRLKKKRRIPGSASESAQSSTQSLHYNTDDVGSPPPPLARGMSEVDMDQSHVSTPRAPTASSVSTTLNPPADQNSSEEKPVVQASTENTLKSGIFRTPSPSLNYVTDQSDLEHAEESDRTDKKEKRRSWRFHRSSKRVSEPPTLSMSPPAPAGSHSGSSLNNSSVVNSTLHNQIMSDTTQVSKEISSSILESQETDVFSGPRVASPPITKDNGDEEKRGFFSKFKAKVSHVKDGIKDKEPEHGRAQSPPASDHDRASFRSSLSFFTKDGKASRGPSADILREQNHSVSLDKSTTPTSSSPPMSVPSGVAHPTATTSPSQTIPDEPSAADVVTVLPKVEEEPSPPGTGTDKPEQVDESRNSSVQAQTKALNKESTQKASETSHIEAIPAAVSSEAVTDTPVAATSGLPSHVAIETCTEAGHGGPTETQNQAPAEVTTESCSETMLEAASTAARPAQAEPSLGEGKPETETKPQLATS
ncbi:GTPase activating protein (GAP) for Rho1p [Emydomyces testavorans]|uniref:GTPase activating protein (GAP) for Rho1p n=1 Tax=Emydomyces testavorans TaxID=2070801 RepID=A0AAF0II65_9EURO|nr:GTPase activating protein (GAP) for Rho1p [Emydomyces testavorans]